jgi:hypothetical protein
VPEEGLDINILPEWAGRIHLQSSWGVSSVG